MPWSVDHIPSLNGKVAVITGANGGLGLASAKAIAARGAHVVMAVRNQEKAANAQREILSEVANASLELVELDLGSLASVKKAADAIMAKHDQVDILLCNAGLMAMPERQTEDGFEMQFGVNHLGHWALTSHLLPTIVRTPGARVVTVSSTAQHMGSPVKADDPHMRGNYDSWKMYGQTKLANRHFAVGLQEQFAAAGVDAKALTSQPGLTDSDLQAHTANEGGAGFLGPFFHRMTAGIGMSTDQGALSQIRACTDPAAEGGDYYAPAFGIVGPPMKRPLVRPGADDAIRVLWEVSERETGLKVDVEAARNAA